MQQRCKPDALNPFGFIFLTNAPRKPVEMHEIGNIGKVMLSTRQENAHWAMRVRSWGRQSTCTERIRSRAERSGVPRDSSQPQMCEEIQELQEKKETPGCVVC